MRKAWHECVDAKGAEATGFDKLDATAPSKSLSYSETIFRPATECSNTNSSGPPTNLPSICNDPRLGPVELPKKFPSSSSSPTTIALEAKSQATA